MGGIVTETYTMVLDTNFNVVDGAVSEKWIFTQIFHELLFNSV
jgi:hypothetical protein